MMPAPGSTAQNQLLACIAASLVRGGTDACVQCFVNRGVDAESRSYQQLLWSAAASVYQLQRPVAMRSTLKVCILV